MVDRLRRKATESICYKKRELREESIQMEKRNARLNKLRKTSEISKITADFVKIAPWMDDGYTSGVCSLGDPARRKDGAMRGEKEKREDGLNRTQKEKKEKESNERKVMEWFDL